jgi:hypothetical protein
MTRTVIGIAATLVNVRVRVTVDNGNSQVVHQNNIGVGTSVVVKSIVSHTAGRFKQAIMAGGRIGLDWGQIITPGKGKCLAASKTGIFIATPEKIKIT